jgi:hypothetical protein
MGSCTHQHDCEEHACAADWSLFKNIEMSGVRALNEAIDGSAKSVFKPWENRLDFSTALESNDDDPELILFIPFTTDVKIKSISIIGGSDGTSPSKMRAFMNRDDIDFSAAADLLPIQEWELAENPHGEIEYLTKYVYCRPQTCQEQSQTFLLFLLCYRRPLLDHFFHLLFSLKETANSLISHYYVDANFSVKCVCRYAKFQGVASLTLHFPRNFGANATCIHYIGLRGEATQVRLTC